MKYHDDDFFFNLQNRKKQASIYNILLSIDKFGMYISTSTERLHYLHPLSHSNEKVGEHS